jgi:hypothetical protein
MLIGLRPISPLLRLVVLARGPEPPDPHGAAPGPFSACWPSPVRLWSRVSLDRHNDSWPGAEPPDPHGAGPGPFSACWPSPVRLWSRVSLDRHNDSWPGAEPPDPHGAAPGPFSACWPSPVRLWSRVSLDRHNDSWPGAEPPDPHGPGPFSGCWPSPVRLGSPVPPGLNAAGQGSTRSLRAERQNPPGPTPGLHGRSRSWPSPIRFGGLPTPSLNARTSVSTPTCDAVGRRQVRLLARLVRGGTLRAAKSLIWRGSRGRYRRDRGTTRRRAGS